MTPSIANKSQGMKGSHAASKGKAASSSSLWTAAAQTPPFFVRLAFLVAYLYAFYLGLQFWLNPFAEPKSEEVIKRAIADMQFSIYFMLVVYSVDAGLAASPLHWCCMRGIPPKNVIEHHIPFVIGMLPVAGLTFFAKESFSRYMLSVPPGCTYMASGCLTSINEALWVASSFFPEALIEHKVYRVGQKFTALCALSQFLSVGSLSAALAAAGLMRSMLETGEDLVVKACMIFPLFAFFTVIPFVQIPLLKGAFGRFVEAARRPSNGAVRSALGLRRWMVAAKGWTT